MLAGWPVPASADRVDRLIQILRTDSSYKVRMRVVITLTGIKDRRVPPALIRALSSDESHLVRGLAARALAQQRAHKALPALRRASRRDRHPFARKQARRAAKALASSLADSKRARIYVTVGYLQNRTRRGGQGVVRVLKRALLNEFERAPGVTTRWNGRRPTGDELRRRKMKGFVLSGTIQRLSRRRSGRNMEIRCRIRVELSTFPGNSMKAFYSGEASMAVASRSRNPAYLRALYREIFAGAAREARNHIVRSYLSRE
jgi:HEAT repeat protein